VPIDRAEWRIASGKSNAPLDAVVKRIETLAKEHPWYPEAGYDSWTETYRNPELMFAQKFSAKDPG
jgi:hypothetical protein